MFMDTYTGFVKTVQGEQQLAVGHQLPTGLFQKSVTSCNWTESGLAMCHAIIHTYYNVLQSFTHTIMFGHSHCGQAHTSPRTWCHNCNGDQWEDKGSEFDHQGEFLQNYMFGSAHDSDNNGVGLPASWTLCGTIFPYQDWIFLRHTSSKLCLMVVFVQNGSILHWAMHQPITFTTLLLKIAELEIWCTQRPRAFEQSLVNDTA